jgi:hypothetical protein
VSSGSVTFDSALASGKGLFRSLYRRTWKDEFIDSMVDNMDWVSAESSGDIQWHFATTGGSVSALDKLWAEPAGSLLTNDIATAWSIAYLTAGWLESGQAEVEDYQAIRRDWVPLVILGLWAVDALRASPVPATVELVRSIQFRRASVESVTIRHTYDYRADFSLDFADARIGWLWSGMMLGGIPHLADRTGYIRDRVLPGRTIVASVDLLDIAGRTVPSVPRSRPSPCPIHWNQDPLPDEQCAAGCDEGDRGSEPGPAELRFVSAPPKNDITIGINVAHQMVGANELIGATTLEPRSEYALLRAWIESVRGGRSGGRPRGPDEELEAFIRSVRLSAASRWGRPSSSGPRGDREVAQEFNRSRPPVPPQPPITVARVRRVRLRLGLRWKKGVLTQSTQARNR